MSDEELDETYTALCHTLTEAGESRTPLILARLSLLLMKQVADAQIVREAIASAADLPPTLNPEVTTP
jgi:hypothetical protein